MVDIKNCNGILEYPSDPKYEPNPEGYGAHCFYKMKEFSNKIAQIDESTNKSETYGEILVKSVRIALHLQSMGIEETDIISLCTNTHSETCLPSWAAAFAGIKFANLDPSLTLSDMKYLSNLVRPKLIFCIPESVNNLEIVIKELDLDTKLVVFGDTEKHIPFKEFLKSHTGEQDFKPKIAKNLFDTVFILFSSGTTGLPKGVCITHYGILSSANISSDIFDMKMVLYYTSPYWISYYLITSSILLSGGARILCKTFDANNVFKLIQDYKITFIFLAPTYIYAVASLPEITCNTSYDTSSLSSIMIGGGSLAAEQVNRLRKLLPHTFINQAYGLTEVTGLFSVFNYKTDSDIAKKKINSCGRMLPGAMCKIVDVDTNEVLGKNKRGELLIKSTRIMGGYYNDSQKTAEVFDEDGFLRTGDVAYYDDDNFFYIVDRIKEMFKYKSWHVVPTELENILSNHPAVEEVLVIGYPHEEDGDHPMAVIVLKNGASVSENDIVQYLNDQVSDRKKLRAGVKFVKTLPKTITGKYNRLKLRSMVFDAWMLVSSQEETQLTNLQCTPDLQLRNVRTMFLYDKN